MVFGQEEKRLVVEPVLDTIHGMSIARWRGLGHMGQHHSAGVRAARMPAAPTPTSPTAGKDSLRGPDRPTHSGHRSAGDAPRRRQAR